MCVLDHVPFVHQREGQESYGVDVKSVIQALIIAGTTSLMGMYATQSVIETKISVLRDDVARIDENVTEIRKDFYIPRP